MTRADLQRVENFVGHPLPPAYKSFLLATNGGRPEPDEVLADLPRGNNRIPIQRFHSISKPVGECELISSFRDFCIENPDDLLPIASVGEGSLICLGIAAHNFGRVFFHDYYAGFRTPHPYRLGDEINYEMYGCLTEFLEAFVEPELDSLERALKHDDATAVSLMLRSGIVGIDERDEYGWTLMERAAMQNSCAVIRMLFESGASLGRALEVAEANAEYFAKHHRAVELIRGLQECSA